MKALYAKLLKIQAEIKPIVKDEKNAAFGGFKYYDINSLLAELKPILAKHEVLLIQAIQAIDGGINVLQTRLIDPVSEEEIITSAPLAQLTDAQKFGGLVTYMRRYALTALFALESEDDDGNTASSTQTQPSAVKSATGGAERPCGICATPFMPTAQYPNAKFCSARCGAAAKLAVAKPVPDDVPFV